MQREQPWTEIVLGVLRSLGADRRAVSVAEIYRAVREAVPLRCDDSSLYRYEAEGRGFSEPKWKKNVRDALVKLERRGLAVRERRGLWRLASQT